MKLFSKRKRSAAFRKKSRPVFPLLPVLLFSCIFCCCSCRENREAQPNELNVAAAANLTDAFTELGREFTARTGVRVVYSYGATADLARQIEEDAPFDVFASADVENVERLERKGLLTGDMHRLYARGRLALWRPRGSGIGLTRIEDLANPEIERIGIARPEAAPYGRASLEALRALNLWPQLEGKVVYGQSVLQVRQYAATGNVDAAFIPLALTRAVEGETIEVDERLYQPINQAVAVIKRSQKQEAARRFVEFVLSPEGQALLERYGYRRP